VLAVVKGIIWSEIRITYVYAKLVCRSVYAYDKSSASTGGTRASAATGVKICYAHEVEGYDSGIEYLLPAQTVE
jgi:hypothetical protein